jgi:hypothetical protein
MVSTELAAVFARDLMRLIQELRAFPDATTIWQTTPGITNSAGTLALHLEGNLREYVGRQLGQIAFTRQRPLEFSTRGVEQAELIARLEAVMELVARVISALSDAQLAADYPEAVLGKPVSTRFFLIHLAGHLNYHLGQVDYLRRFVTSNGAIELAGLP